MTPPSCASVGTAGPRRLAGWCAFCLALVALWSCLDTLTFDFVARDDDINIYFNPHLGPPGTESFRWMFTDLSYMRRYVPLGWLSFSVVYQFSGLSPVGYHAANVLLHVLNTLLVFSILFHVASRFVPGVAVGRRLAAVTIAAALWALHPLRAETIGWASGLLYGMAGFWALLGTLAYLPLVSPAQETSRRGAAVAISAICYTLSILTYPIAIALPFVFFALDFVGRTRAEHRLRRLWWLAIEKLAFLIPGGIVAACTVLGRFESSAFWPRPPTWEEFSLAQRAAQGFAVWACYLWKTSWPVGLTQAPTWLFDVRPLAPLFLGSAFLVSGITVLLAAHRPWRNALLLWLSYLVLLLPMLGFTDHPHFASDRYAYLASVTLSAAVLLVVLRASPRVQMPVLAILAVATLTLGLLQRRQLAVWENTDTLFAQTLEHSTDRDFTADNFRKWARFHLHRSDLDAARSIVGAAESAVGGHPHVVAVRAEFATVTADPKRRPLASILHEKLAIDFSRRGRMREAREHFAAARRLAPNISSIAFNWAVFAALAGDPAQALRLHLWITAPAVTDRPDMTAQLRLLVLVADAFSHGREARAAAAVARAALALAEASGDPELLISTRERLARHLMPDSLPYGRTAN